MTPTGQEAFAYAVLIVTVIWLRILNLRLSRTLTNLRANAYLRNEKGQIVRYANASREVRAKAEQN